MDAEGLMDADIQAELGTKGHSLIMDTLRQIPRSKNATDTATCNYIRLSRQQVTDTTTDRLTATRNYGHLSV